MKIIVHLHPMLVHFPIGFLFASVLFDLINKWTHKQDFKKAAYYLLFLGLLFGIFASGVGVYIENVIEESGVSEKHLDDHKGFAIATLACFAFLFAFRVLKKNQFSENVLSLYLILSLAGLLLLTITGFYGGKLVYEDGAAVHFPNKTMAK